MKEEAILIFLLFSAIFSIGLVSSAEVVCNLPSYDTNGDGVVNVDDLQILLELLLSGEAEINEILDVLNHLGELTEEICVEVEDTPPEENYIPPATSGPSGTPTSGIKKSEVSLKEGEDLENLNENNDFEEDNSNNLEVGRSDNVGDNQEIENSGITGRSISLGERFSNIREKINPLAFVGVFIFILTILSLVFVVNIIRNKAHIKKNNHPEIVKLKLFHNKHLKDNIDYIKEKIRELKSHHSRKK